MHQLMHQLMEQREEQLRAPQKKNLWAFVTIRAKMTLSRNAPLPRRSPLYGSFALLRQIIVGQGEMVIAEETAICAKR